ncbi:MAG: hypothetical protein QM695_12025 [Micropruina sp.]
MTMLSLLSAKAALVLASGAMLATALPAPQAAEAAPVLMPVCAVSAPVASTLGQQPTAVCCVVSNQYSVTATATRIKFKDIPSFKNGPGGTLTVSRQYSGSATYSVTAGAESEVGAVLAKAKVSISGTLSKTNSTGATNTYSHKITKKKYGHAQYVSWGKKVNYRKYRINRDCRTTTIATGTINFPSSEEGWYYWETAK